MTKMHELISPDYRMGFKFKIEPDERAYLIVQKGALDNLKSDPDAWEAAYNQSINNAFNTIKPYLPEKCESVLDVGSGLGGIDALINNYFGGDVHVTLLDGVDDQPVVSLHRKTFNNMKVAEKFLTANGVKNFNFVSPDFRRGKGIALASYNLIVSFGAWCFHIDPQEYLTYVLAHCRSGTVVILDVRNNRPDWFEELEGVFGKGQIIRTTEKFTKWKFVYEQ